MKLIDLSNNNFYFEFVVTSELMLLGFISLFLTVVQNPVFKICILKSVGSSWHPCDINKHIDDQYLDPCRIKVFFESLFFQHILFTSSFGGTEFFLLFKIFCTSSQNLHTDCFIGDSNPYHNIKNGGWITRETPLIGETGLIHVYMVNYINYNNKLKKLFFYIKINKPYIFPG